MNKYNPNLILCWWKYILEDNKFYPQFWPGTLEDFNALLCGPLHERNTAALLHTLAWRKVVGQPMILHCSQLASSTHKPDGEGKNKIYKVLYGTNVSFLWVFFWLHMLVVGPRYLSSAMADLGTCGPNFFHASNGRTHFAQIVYRFFCSSICMVLRGNSFW